MSQIISIELTPEAGAPGAVADAVMGTTTELGALAQAVPPGGGAEATFTLTSGVVVQLDEPIVREDDPYLLAFGLRRATSVDFLLGRAGTEQEADDQLDQVFLVAVALLDRLAGDLVLHYEHFQAFLARRDGRLVVDEDEARWPPERLALLGDRPYERAPLPSPA